MLTFSIENEEAVRCKSLRKICCRKNNKIKNSHIRRISRGEMIVPFDMMTPE